jgi:hypothetical protein
MLNYLLLNSMKRFYPLAIILCCVVQLCTLASCNNFLCPPSNEEKVVAIEQNPLFPLKVGNYWRYTLVWYYPLFNTYDTVPAPSSYPRITRIVSDTVITYQQSQYKCVMASNSNLLWFSTKSEVFSFQTLTVFDTTFKNLTLRFPMQLNDTIVFISHRLIASRTDPYIQQDVVPLICVGVNKEYPTPAGTFQCSVVKYLTTAGFGENLAVYRYYAPNIGLVADETYQIDATGKEVLNWKYILTEYKIQ